MPKTKREPYSAKAIGGSKRKRQNVKSLDVRGPDGKKKPGWTVSGRGSKAFYAQMPADVKKRAKDKILDKTGEMAGKRAERQIRRRFGD